MAQEIELDYSSGCFVIKKSAEGPKLVLVYCKWNNGKEGWIIPKGHIEEGETKEQTALREVAEETGYKNITIKKILKEVIFEFEKEGIKHKKTIYWHLGELINEEHIEPMRTEDEKVTMKSVDWKSLLEAKALIPFTDEQEIIDGLIKEYQIS